MDAVTKAIKKLRGQIRPKEPPPTAFEILMADLLSKQAKKDMWTADKITNRDASFAKARLVRQQNLEERRLAREAESERQGIIAETRTKNLKKARRRLRWIRKQEQE